MSVLFVDTAIVVLAQAHNPTILHPSFLSSQNIVPKDWEPDEPPICTPPFAIVRYHGRFELISEPNKLQFRDTKPQDGVETSEVVDIAKKYVSSLPHVNYTAVGINFTLFWDMDDPNNFLKDRFLRHGPWNEADLTLEAFGLRFVYPHRQAKFHVSVDSGRRLTEQAIEREGVVMRGNYDRRLTLPQTADQVVTAISQFEDCSIHFTESCKEILGLSA